MEIKTTKKSITEASQTYTRIKLIEKGTERFILEAGNTTLEVVSGSAEKITPRTFRTLVRTIVQTARKHKIKKIVLDLPRTHFPKLQVYDDVWYTSTIVENVLLASYEYTTYKTKKDTYALEEVLLCGITTNIEQNGIERGKVVGLAANTCRDIANTPGGDMTPAKLAERAKMALKGTNAKVTILDEPAIKKLKMGGVLGVGQGAQDKPKFIVIEYRGGAKSGKSTTSKKEGGPIVFVGKGVTFDTGGLQVKPGMAMYEMHMDMSGGAAVIAALSAIAHMKLPVHVIGLIPAAENAISDRAIRPGDVLTLMSGTTVDVLHTDAEGRLILADALHYARKYKPRLVVDVATLTGAAAVAVGQHAHAIMTKDRELEDRFRELGEETGDYTFPLPLWDEYTPYLKGVHGDIANIPSGDTRFGGAIIGGTFLAHFMKKIPWVHIDMAPRMTSVASDKLAKGATGEPVRLLVKVAECL